jgi:hypothetical protein
MVTIFTTAKPFRGHNRVIQRNALRSWRLLHPEAEVILFGDDEGAAEVCAEYGLRHEPQVERFRGKVPYVNELFTRAQRMARHEFLCYANCDIIFLPDFCDAIAHLQARWAKFMAVGRCWNMDITEPIDFARRDWVGAIRTAALNARQQQSEWFIDYFAFSRNFFTNDIPPLAVGRARWDNWILWKACESGNPVVDLSASVVAIHQNHDYGHLPEGKAGVYGGPDVERNLELAGGYDHMRTIGDAKFLLRSNGLKRNYQPLWRAFMSDIGRLRRFVRFQVWNPIWFVFLDTTRPMRKWIGVRKANR